MTEFYVITEEEAVVLRDLIDWWRKQPKSTAPKQQELIAGQSMDRYIVKLPTGGIAARNDTTVTAENCDVYKIGANDDLVSAGHQIKVYNPLDGTLSETGTPYIVVTRDKYGKWTPPVSINYAYAVTLASTLADGASTSVTLSDGRSVTAINRSGATLAAGNAIAIEDLFTGQYMLTGAGTGGGGTAETELVEGLVYTPFNKQSTDFVAKVMRAYLDTVAVDQQLTVKNYLKPDAITYLFEGEYNACCLFKYDSSDSVWRLIWVECPERSPVETTLSPGEQSQNFMMAQANGAAAAGGQF